MNIKKHTVLSAFIFCVIISFCACKKIEVKGKVYSKHYYPVADAKIVVTYLTSHGTERMNVTSSDGNGEYNFTFQAESKYKYIMNCESDSGQASSGITIKYQKTNNIDIHTAGN